MADKRHAKTSKKFTNRQIFATQSNISHHIHYKNREPIFKNFAYARLIINALKQSDELQHTNTLAFVVMPDHIHWLLALGGNQKLHQVIKTIKSKVTIKIGKHIWQAGYYDHATRKDEDIVNTARHVIANPIRAGLVKRVCNYPHWDAVWL